MAFFTSHLTRASNPTAAERRVLKWTPETDLTAEKFNEANQAALNSSAVKRWSSPFTNTSDLKEFNHNLGAVPEIAYLLFRPIFNKKANNDIIVKANESVWVNSLETVNYYTKITSSTAQIVSTLGVSSALIYGAFGSIDIGNSWQYQINLVLING